MARDFDETRRARFNVDRSFIIGGETFYFRAAVSAETLTEYYDIKQGLQLVEDNADFVKRMDGVVLEMLEPGQEAKWAAARASTDYSESDGVLPIALGDIYDVIDYMVEVMSGRPTVSPDESSPGRPETERTPSVPSSSSPAATPTA